MEARKIITPLIRKNKKGITTLDLYENIPDHDFEDISSQLNKRLNLNDDTDLEILNKNVLPIKRLCQKGFLYIQEIEGVPISSQEQIEQIEFKQNKKSIDTKEEEDYNNTDKEQYSVSSEDYYNTGKEQYCASSDESNRDYKVLKVDELNFLEELEDYKSPTQAFKIKRKKCASQCGIRIKICKIKL